MDRIHVTFTWHQVLAQSAAAQSVGNGGVGCRENAAQTCRPGPVDERSARLLTVSAMVVWTVEKTPRKHAGLVLWMSGLDARVGRGLNAHRCA